jgi:hypothetical protein
MTLAEVRQSLIDYLCAQGVHAIAAWSGEKRKGHPKGVAVVSLEGLRLAPLGQQNYLGLRTEDDSTAQVPVYGRKVSLTFGIQLYVPKGEAELCQELFQQLGQALCCGGPEGLVVEELSCGAISFDSDSGSLTCPCQLTSQTWCYLATQEEGSVVTDFIVKGEPK